MSIHTYKTSGSVLLHEATGTFLYKTAGSVLLKVATEFSGRRFFYVQIK